MIVEGQLVKFISSQKKERSILSEREKKKTHMPGKERYLLYVYNIKEENQNDCLISYIFSRLIASLNKISNYRE